MALDSVEESLLSYREATHDDTHSYSSRSNIPSSKSISPMKNTDHHQFNSSTSLNAKRTPEETIAMILLGEYKSGGYRTPRRQSGELEHRRKKYPQSDERSNKKILNDEDEADDDADKLSKVKSENNRGEIRAMGDKDFSDVKEDDL